MRVYILIWNFAFGGAQKFVVKLANAYQRKGHSVTILVADDHGSLKELLSEDVQVQQFKIPNTNNPIKLLGLNRKMKNTIERDSMVFVNGPNNFRQLARLNFFSRRWKLIFRLHNDIIIKPSFLSMFKRFEMRQLFGQNRVRILAMSENQKKEHSQSFKTRNVRHIPNFFPEAPKRSYIRSDSRLNAICLGRLSVEKGIQTLVEALSLVKFDVKVDVFGDGPLKNELVKRIDQLQLRNIEFKAPVLNVDETLSKYDFLILPSLSETFGNAVVEAFNVGLPVVSTDCAGPLNLIEPGLNGLVARRGDHVSLAMKIDKLCELIINDALDEEFIRASVPVQYREAAVIEQHLKLFEN
ncbi:hypothetical protein BFP97_08910 [Roseivirga sp. 4D4]|uniref:glycosyltransferase family 4 protein n=1 Tax=Roseivirga sp. 4D4 TaxID=1889784 RepID=UPI000852E352|nr:glycosyltransferase family 4 protein [Roseivirga sp. 4D4]OEK01626.1 hypothetical protein BFP97_08910 [Roseivirga sp. 4D4]